MAFEQVGVEAVIEGMAAFRANADEFNNTIGRGMTGAAEGAASALSGLGDIAAGALKVGLAAAAAGTAALAGGFVFAFGQAMEAEKTLTRLNTVIKGTGGAAGLTLEQAQDLANQFKNLAGGSDDAVLAIEEMALRMGTVSAEEMPKFIQTTLDLAAATGVDAVAAARLLAQAQEDPISALGRFRRMGILFTEDQEKQIKAMVEAGDVAGANALMMDRLAQATGGAAAANAATLAGQWEILKGTIGEAAESIGMAFLPIAHELFDRVIAPAIPLIEEFGNAIGTAFSIFLGEGDIQAAIESLMEFDSIRAIFQGLGIDLYDVGNIVEDFVENAQIQFTNLIISFQPVITAAKNLAAAFIESMPMIQTYVNDMVTFVQGLIAEFAPAIVENISSALNSMAEFWREHGDEVMAVVNFAFRVISTTIGTTLTLVSGLIALTMNAINGDWSGAWATIEGTLTTVMNSILSIVGIDLDSFTESWSGTFDLAGQILQTFSDNIIVWLSQGLLNAIAAAQSIVAGVSSIGQALIDGIKAGVINAAGGLAAAAAQVVRDAIQAAKDAVGIQSPSALAMKEIGQPFAEGIAKGILSAMREVQAAAATVSMSAVSSAASVVGGGGNHSTNTTNTYQYAPVYSSVPRNPSQDFALMQAVA